MSEKQKKIWITGASSGIGKSVAEKFANEGWKVAVSARRKELLDELAKNPNIVSFPLDVTNRNQINEVFKNIIDNFGDLDICLFSSGTYEPKDEQNIDPDKIKNVINVNFLGVIDCVKSVERYFRPLSQIIITIVFPAISSESNFSAAATLAPEENPPNIPSCFARSLVVFCASSPDI